MSTGAFSLEPRNEKRWLCLVLSICCVNLHSYTEPSMNKNTKPFEEYTKEEMLECLKECYAALVSIYYLTKKDGSHHDEVIFETTNQPLNKMWERTI